MERHTHMKTLKTLMSAVVVLAVAWASDARAAGIAVDLNSARGVAMAGSMVGFVDDASAIYYNPAGIAQGQGIDVMLGITGIVPYFNVTAADGTQTTGNHAIIPPPHIYATYGISDEITVGIGVFTPYGLAISWPDGYPGRYIATSVDLKIFDMHDMGDGAGKFVISRIDKKNPEFHGTHQPGENNFQVSPGTRIKSGEGIVEYEKMGALQQGAGKQELAHFPI